MRSFFHVHVLTNLLMLARAPSTAIAIRRAACTSSTISVTFARPFMLRPSAWVALFGASEAPLLLAPSLRPGARAHAFAPYCRSPRYLPAPSSTIPAQLFASRPRPFLLRVQPYVHTRASCARRARGSFFAKTRPGARAHAFAPYCCLPRCTPRVSYEYSVSLVFQQPQPNPPVLPFNSSVLRSPPPLDTS